MADITSNLIAHWKLDEVSGLSAADSALSHTGTLTNMVGDEWTAGVVDGALQFDGVDDVIVVPHAADLAMHGVGSCSFAFFHKTIAGVSPIFIEKYLNGLIEHYKYICEYEGEV